ncbi:MULTISPECIES: DUF6123 family protein [Robertmurraya]|uniref:DUF6123 family protein n=1 Tax=Robertmurraya beringensis TaxID=641660 RepID=A0ABV6KXL6_9BACI|nr:Uncharacterised protein [Mycobacteroides abscessus subsp. abscessus]
MSTEEYVSHLLDKGFLLKDDAIGFIYFGKNYTGASDELANVAIEVTLKAQKSFDGSFYVSLLEWLLSNQIKTKKEAYQFIREAELLTI